MMASTTVINVVIHDGVDRKETSRKTHLPDLLPRTIKAQLEADNPTLFFKAFSSQY